MTITVPPDDDGFFGMTSFKGLVSESVYVARLAGAAHQAKAAAAQTETANRALDAQAQANQAIEQGAAASVESANTKVDLAQQKARATNSRTT